MKNSNHTLLRYTPAAPRDDRWKDATPLGNGVTGALVFGDVGTEHIRLTHAAVWDGGTDVCPPDTADLLPGIRALMDAKEYMKANTLLQNRLRDLSYRPGLAAQFPICDMELCFSYSGLKDKFYHYRRLLHMDCGVSEISYAMGDVPVKRECFVSRDDGCFYMRITAGAPISVFLSAVLPRTDVRRDTECQTALDGARVFFTRPCRAGVCGVLYTAGQTDGRVTPDPSGITVTDFTSLTLVLRVFEKPGDSLPENPCYASALARHTALHKALYGRADIRLYDGEAHANETLLTEAFSEDASPELLEKLWRFGRYLFISGTAEDSLPFPLYGLWTGDYDLLWAQHVSNENVQIIYWHILAGGMPELMRPLIRYFYEKIPRFRENALRLFGCHGIAVSAYTTPDNSYLAPPVSVILHFTTASGWLCRHFFDYYEATGDEKTLTGEILPFALETARFFEEYAVIRDGRLLWYPSVSPENTPAEFVDPASPMAHHMPTTKNATIELAIIKETLTRLRALCVQRGICEDRIPTWDRLLRAIGPYEINDRGAVREWQDPDFSDSYCHRHLSHIYPVFPGCEVTKENNPELFAAFEKAVDLRELGGQSGWSLAHMAGIYARLGRGEDLLDCLDLLCRGCLLPNFFTVHNDWRSDHLTLVKDKPPIQLDALMGAVNALQQMLLDWDGHTLHLLPALPSRLRKGEAEGLAFPGGTVSLSWDGEAGSLRIRILPTDTRTVSVSCPDGRGGRLCRRCALKKGVPFELV